MSHPLAHLPLATVLQAPGHSPRVLVVMISRGVAPLMPALDAARRARDFGAGFGLVAGLPAVEAKNRAVDLATEAGASLLLVEDDVLADAEVWRRAMGAPPSAVRYAEAICRNGSLNTRLHADGAPLYTGTPFVLLPATVLAALPRPLFVANEYGIAAGELFLRGPSAKGHGSDVHLWHTLRQLSPRPAVECVGRVACLVHRLNRAGHDLQAPEVVEVLA